MRAPLFIAVFLAAAAAGLRAEDPLSAAKDLYASAAYEEALTALTTVAGSATPDVARQAEEYRAFCLYALGRTREAESIAESLIRQQPLSRLDAADASPRLERLFADVRQRLLPSLIRERFRTAKAAIEQKNLTSAEPLLVEAALMIVQADTIGVKDEGLQDLSVLVDGFLQLIRTAAEQRAALQAAATVATVSAPAGPGAPVAAAAPPADPPASRVAAASPAPAAASSPAATAPASPAALPRGVASAPAAAPPVYTVDDRDVVAPVTIDQSLPPIPAAVHSLLKTSNKPGIFDVVIDETGHVIDAKMRQSLNPFVDTIILQSARRWRYEPASRNGVPVRFLKTIAFTP